MQQLLYVSNTARDIGQPVLDAILASSRRNNTRLDVTGMLLYIDGGFLQILEGEAPVLDKLYATIGADRRHRNAHILLKREAPRTFHDWSMGFHQISPSTDADMFRISLQAVMGHMAHQDTLVMLRLMENFYRIQSAENRFPAASTA